MFFEFLYSVPTNANALSNIIFPEMFTLFTRIIQQIMFRKSNHYSMAKKNDVARLSRNYHNLTKQFHKYCIFATEYKYRQSQNPVSKKNYE